MNNSIHAFSKVWEKFLESQAQRPAPCDGCKNYRRCAAEELACTAFFFYVSPQNDKQKKSYKKREINKIPDREIYDKIFNQEAEDAI